MQLWQLPCTSKVVVLWEFRYLRACTTGVCVQLYARKQVNVVVPEECQLCRLKVATSLMWSALLVPFYTGRRKTVCACKSSFSWPLPRMCMHCTSIDSIQGRRVETRATYSVVPPVNASVSSGHLLHAHMLSMKLLMSHYPYRVCVYIPLLAPVRKHQPSLGLELPLEDANTSLSPIYHI